MSRIAPTGLLRWICLASMAIAAIGNAQERVRKQVFLVVDGDRLVASNVRTSSFAEHRLDARERIMKSAEGEGVIMVVTNQRLLAYGAVSGWSARDRDANESVESISVADYAGLIVTNKRLLNFNGETGVWGERQRGLGQ